MRARSASEQRTSTWLLSATILAGDYWVTRDRGSPPSSQFPVFRGIPQLGDARSATAPYASSMHRRRVGGTAAVACSTHRQEGPTMSFRRKAESEFVPSGHERLTRLESDRSARPRDRLASSTSPPCALAPFRRAPPQGQARTTPRGQPRPIALRTPLPQIGNTRDELREVNVLHRLAGLDQGGAREAECDRRRRAVPVSGRARRGGGMSIEPRASADWGPDFPTPCPPLRQLERGGIPQLGDARSAAAPYASSMHRRRVGGTATVACSTHRQEGPEAMQ